MPRLILGVNDLATVNPELAAEWHPTKNGDITPHMVRVDSGEYRYWWLGKCGHEWRATVYSRCHGKSCPVCGRKMSAITRTKNQILSRGSLFETDPSLAAQWHPTLNGELTPKMVTAKSGRKVWWKCSEGHEWQAPISNRSNGKGCPYCSGRIAIPGKTDLSTVNPLLAAEWHPTKNFPFTASQFTAKSGKKVWWLGSCGHEWEASIKSRTQGNICPVCRSSRTAKTHSSKQSPDSQSQSS